MRARPAKYRASRVFVGTLEPWVRANVGPQLVSAYVDTVLVRPGAVVRRGEVLATLDCRDASASVKAITARARALDTHQKAVAHESARTQDLLAGGFVSPNEAEQKASESASEEAQLEAERANLARSSLQVSDCVLRAPFAGEVSARAVDPGAFVRPGSAIVTVVDRGTVRVTADAPETDFAVVAPGTKVNVRAYATGRDLPATITRRAPAADPATRTVRFEIDVPDAARSLPVGTTAEIRLEVGEALPATEIPLYAATIRGAKATLFTVVDDVARSRTLPVLGEAGGSVFLDPALRAGTSVVTEGRALLGDGDRVAAKEAR
jgi:RND family efflux transporter MFP subunit